MKPQIDDREREVLLRLLRSLNVFKLLNERMPLQYVTSFLAVATDEGNGVTHYAKRLGVNVTTMSRHLLDIGERNRNMEPGYGLVTYRADPLELRKHQYFLTPKGKQLIHSIMREIDQ